METKFEGRIDPELGRKALSKDRFMAAPGGNAGVNSG